MDVQRGSHCWNPAARRQTSHDMDGSLDPDRQFDWRNSGLRHGERIATVQRRAAMLNLHTKEIFLFNDALNTFYLRLYGVGLHTKMFFINK